MSSLLLDGACHRGHTSGFQRHVRRYPERAHTTNDGEPTCARQSVYILCVLNIYWKRLTVFCACCTRRRSPQQRDGCYERIVLCLSLSLSFFSFVFFNQVAKNCVLLLFLSVFGQMNQRLDGGRGSGAAVQSVTKFRVG